MMRFIILLIFTVLFSACSPSSSKKPEESSSTQPIRNAHNQNFFENVTTKTGLGFVQQAGTNYFMADSLGSGIALLDFDQDGQLDIYFVQNGRTGSGLKNVLYHQEQNCTFKDVSDGSGLDITGRGMGAIAGDINNDGLPDMVVTEYSATRVFQNLGGGHFREITTEAAIDNPRWAAPAGFIDFDRDGWLDLVVGNYIDYDPTQLCNDQQGRQDFCGPKAFPSTATRLWHNITRNAGAVPKFEDWTVRSGIVRSPGVALGLICADFTGDNWPDIFCADDQRPNRLFVNQQNGTFKEEASLRGLAYDAMGHTAANMGTAFADFDGDALPDLFVTHLTEEFHSLFRQDKPGLFMDVVGQSGLQQQSWRGTGFGTVAADFDSDGWVDIAFVNGLVRRANTNQLPVLAGVDPWWTRYAQRSQIFANNTGHFRDVSAANPAFCGEASVGRSVAVGDLDNDGAPDLVFSNIGGPAQIYRNVAKLRGHWLKLRLVDPSLGGRDAIGATVRFKAGSRQWWSVLQPASSYLASNDPALHFGLGEVANIDRAEVIWPSGGAEIFRIGKTDQLLVLKKGSGEKAAR
jgi:hypothetical protein